MSSYADEDQEQRSIEELQKDGAEKPTCSSDVNSFDGEPVGPRGSSGYANGKNPLESPIFGSNSEPQKVYEHSFTEHERNEDMESALQHQAQLIGRYEEEEKAQREWEEKFRENNSGTQKSLPPDSFPNLLSNLEVYSQATHFSLLPIDPSLLKSGQKFLLRESYTTLPFYYNEVPIAHQECRSTYLPQDFVEAVSSSSIFLGRLTFVPNTVPNWDGFGMTSDGVGTQRLDLVFTVPMSQGRPTFRPKIDKGNNCPKSSQMLFQDFGE
ncbi:hypothetical protein Sango_2677500 [Sesamum angolense]|uniref:Uncharacterized protein n=1 Tax=Sesamum angolense TaxID=2727404 RepID=A0AAE2BHI4_9LAMI|nr:hypothetical protein Sango_2677500 [Sesamum angolense]